MQLVISIVVALAASVVFAARQAHGATVVSPNAQATVEGSSNYLFPFDIGEDVQEVPGGTLRYQQVYSAADFSALPPGGGFLTQIAFRPDTMFGKAFNSTLPSIRIDLSATLAQPGALSVAFSANVGTNNITVFGGTTGAPLSLTSAFIGPAGGPKSFDIIINLTTPFFYNPATGNLLLDVRNFGGGITTTFDWQSSSRLSLATTMASGVASGAADSRQDGGLVTRFTFAGPPLTIANAGTNVILTWPTNSTGFILQSAPHIRGLFTNIPGATGPYTNSLVAPQQFFRLISP